MCTPVDVHTKVIFKWVVISLNSLTMLHNRKYMYGAHGRIWSDFLESKRMLISKFQRPLTLHFLYVYRRGIRQNVDNIFDSFIAHDKFKCYLRLNTLNIIVTFYQSRKVYLLGISLILFGFLGLLVACMSKLYEGLVVELGEGIPMESNIVHIEPARIEDSTQNDNTSWTYLCEGGLIPFMECIEGHDERVFSQIINSWKD